MGLFWAALFDPDLSFLRYALVAGLLASLAFGMMGTYVVVRRISYIAGAIAHSVLGGIGISLYLQYHSGLTWFAPIYGAVLASLASAIVIGLVSMYARQREDTVIGAIWAVGMATGVVFISKTPGYVDPMSYLFGNILMITSTDLWGILILDILVVGIGILFYYKFHALCFDEEFSRLRGIRVTAYYLLLLCLISLSVVLLVMVVGIVMVIALLTIPAAVAGLFSRHLWQMMLVSTLACMVFTIGGLGISYSHDLPAGATIILLAAAVYLLLIFVRYVLGRMAGRNSAKAK